MFKRHFNKERIKYGCQQLHDNVHWWNVPTENAAEDSRHRVVVELIDSDGVEVTKEARRDGVATAT